MEERWHLDVAGKTVIVWDDIFETGVTVHKAVEAIKAAGAKSVYSGVMLYRDCERPDSFTYRPDYYALSVGPGFVLGTGLDFAGVARSWGGIYKLQDKQAAVAEATPLHKVVRTYQSASASIQAGFRYWRKVAQVSKKSAINRIVLFQLGFSVGNTLNLINKPSGFRRPAA